MSKILRRPMFRGGKVSSYGTGIASGLGYNDGGRVGFQEGGKSGLDFLKSAFLGPRFTDPNYKPPQLFPKNVSAFNIGNIGQSPKDFASALQEGSAYSEYLKKPEDEFETEITASGDIKLKLDEKGNPIKKDIPNLTLAEEIEKKRIENITDQDTQGADLNMFKLGTTTSGTDITKERAEEKKIDKTLASVKSEEPKEPKETTEESTELKVEDYIKLLGGDKARRRDLGDMLGRASAAFLGTGGVKEGLAQFMAAEAGAGPSRLEKIEQAAATLDIKDKIATKRAKEQLQQTLAGIDYKIGASAAAAKRAGDVANMDFYDGTEYIAANVFKGNKRPNSPAVIAETLRQKFKTPTYKITKELEQVNADTLKEGFTVVVTSDGAKVFLKEGNKVTRQPQFEIG